MRKILLGAALLSIVSLASAANALAGPRPLKLVLSPRSTVPPAEVMRHLSSHCPNVSITQDSLKSDFMLEAWGWSGNYKFTVFAHGGDAVFATSTMRLGNAVKDVCKYINAHSPEPTK
jgi:hypothetical protein